MSGGWLGVLAYVVSPELADEAVGDGLAWEMRLRSLPARLSLYFTLGLCLFRSSPYREVIRQVTAGLAAPLAAAGWLVPASTPLSAARARLGEAPLRSLFARLRSPLSPGVRDWPHVGGLLAVALDGTLVPVRDTPASQAALGPPAASGGGPRLRLAALAACGTRALLDAAAGPAFGPGSGEQSMAGDLLASLREGMLLLADRDFYSWKLWHAAAGTGAELLWRVSAAVRLRPLAELPDGSWLAHVDDPAEVARRNRKNGARRRRGSRLPPGASPLPGGMTVRVIEYHVTVTADDGTTRAERCRLLTTLAGYRAFPAPELAAAYARRWDIETGFAELKDFLGAGHPLRGGTPELARQEPWALLSVCQALRALIARAAAGAGTDPARSSFTAAPHAARRTMSASRRHLGLALDQAEAEILDSPVPLREGRVYPRAVKQPAARYPSRANATTPVSQHATATLTLTPPGTHTQTTSRQRKHQATTPKPPP